MICYLLQSRNEKGKCSLFVLDVCNVLEISVYGESKSAGCSAFIILISMVSQETWKSRISCFTIHTPCFTTLWSLPLPKLLNRQILLLDSRDSSRHALSRRRGIDSPKSFRLGLPLCLKAALSNEFETSQDHLWTCHPTRYANDTTRIINLPQLPEELPKPTLPLRDLRKDSGPPYLHLSPAIPCQQTTEWKTQHQPNYKSFKNPLTTSKRL